MYRETYGLIEKPFKLTPDPKFFFGQAGHAEARELLRYSIREREGFMCFIGPAGTGKTTMLRAALEDLGTDTVTAMIFNPQLSEEDFLRLILVEFGVVPAAEFDSDVASEIGRQEMLEYFHRFLLDLSAEGRTAVLVIDEAQSLPLPVMEQIRLLSNLETSSEKLIQIVLAGQSGLLETLRRPELNDLAQRVAVRYTLRPFDTAELGRYVEHRLRVAGSCGELRFEPEAFERMHRCTGGVPRLVNLLADRALLAGYAAQTNDITAALIDSAAATLELGGYNEPPVERDHPVMVAAPEIASPAAVAGASPVARSAVREPQQAEPAATAGRVAPAAAASAGASAGRPTSSKAANGLLEQRGFRPWQAAVGVAVAMAVTVGGYAGWQRQQVPQLQAPASVRADGSLTGLTNGHFGTGVPAAELATPRAAYTIYLSSHRSAEDQALIEARKSLEQTGYVSFLMAADVTGRGTLYRLTVGEYADREAALEAARGLRARLGLAHAEPVAVADVAGS